MTTVWTDAVLMAPSAVLKTHLATGLLGAHAWLDSMEMGKSVKVSINIIGNKICFLVYYIRRSYIYLSKNFIVYGAITAALTPEAEFAFCDECGLYQRCVRSPDNEEGRKWRTGCSCSHFNCPTEPASHQKICGSDGHTYPSLCHMRKASCLSQQPIYLLHSGKCQENGKFIYTKSAWSVSRKLIIMPSCLAFRTNWPAYHTPYAHTISNQALSRIDKFIEYFHWFSHLQKPAMSSNALLPLDYNICSLLPWWVPCPLLLHVAI